MTCRCGFEWGWEGVSVWGRTHYDHQFDRMDSFPLRIMEEQHHEVGVYQQRFHEYQLGVNPRTKPGSFLNVLTWISFLIILPALVFMIPILMIFFWMGEDNFTNPGKFGCECGVQIKEYWRSLRWYCGGIWIAIFIGFVMYGILLGLVLLLFCLPGAYIVGFTNLIGEGFVSGRGRSPFYMGWD